MEGNEKTGVSEIHLLAGAGFFLLYKLYVAFAAWWNGWIAVTLHQIYVAGAGIVALNVILIWGWLKMTAIRKNNSKKMAVLGNAPDAVYCGESE